MNRLTKFMVFSGLILIGSAQSALARCASGSCIDCNQEDPPPCCDDDDDDGDGDYMPEGITVIDDMSLDISDEG